MDPDQLLLRKRIADAAVELYMQDNTPFTINRIAARAEVRTHDVYRFYSTRDQILADFYNLMPTLFTLQVKSLEGYDQFQLADRLSNFIFTTFDMMQEYRSFVQKTFVSLSGSDDCTPWQKGNAQVLMQIFDNDPGVSDLNRVLIPDFAYDLAADVFTQLIEIWLTDTSDGTGKTLALVEKSTSFIQEVMYSDVLGKGIDLVRYVYTHVAPDHPAVQTLRKYTCSNK